MFATKGTLVSELRGPSDGMRAVKEANGWKKRPNEEGNGIVRQTMTQNYGK